MGTLVVVGIGCWAGAATVMWLIERRRRVTVQSQLDRFMTDGTAIIQGAIAAAEQARLIVQGHRRWAQPPMPGKEFDN